MDFDLSIDIIIDLAAILLESEKRGSVNLQDLGGAVTFMVTIIVSSKERGLINKTLKHFSKEPFAYDLSKEFNKRINIIDEITEPLWEYDAPGEEGWGTVIEYIKNHIEK